MRINILYEDKDIVVVNKPAGMIVHTAPGHEDGALCDYLVKTRPEMKLAGSKERPGVVHRLDIETSGVMVFAKNKKSYFALRDAFESHTKIKKTYLAVLHGAPKSKIGTLKTLIGRKPWDSKRMAVVDVKGQAAITHWEVLKKSSGISIVEFVIETGRTHQVRVHAAYLGCPLVGDKLYGDEKKDARLSVKPKRQLLHAVELSFEHPITKKEMTFAVPPPADIIYAH